VIRTDGSRPRVLLDAYERAYGLSFAYDVVEPYTALSENNTGVTLRALCACVAAYKDAGYDGIVVTHGTDTLQYSAAALSYAFADITLPLCLVSANYPVEDARSNALANLRGAVRFIREVNTPGVWVSYQNTGEALCIHRGTRLMDGMAFTDRVESILSTHYGTFMGEAPFVKNLNYRESPNGMSATGVLPLDEVSAQILRVNPHPGMVYPALGAGVRYVLHTSYHSGTINTVSGEALRFFAEAKERGIPVFLTGVMPGDAYASTEAFEALGIQRLYNLASVAAYMKLWMLDALRGGEPVTAELLQTPLAGDVVPE
jgi:L-asparaginase